ncbi:restriction endonuclease subunit S [Streptococcus suis]|uniref:restriction endonuclease subunit S n=1 Tax=Streptococcus suis TaxID=1307 RepID=UPI0005CE50AB|nr:restriction endonuclease subunit S [Streptococcus suis]CYV05838.1 type I restriction-modification system S protein [Streptococcus suis]
MPYDIPDSWEWVRVSNICTTNIGLTFKPSDVQETGIPVYKANNIKDGKISTLDLAFVSEKTKIKENEWLTQNDILMAVRSGSKQLVGKTAVIEDLKTKTSFGAFMSVIRPISVSSVFMNHFFQSGHFRSQLDEANTTTIFQVTQKMLKESILPLPPLAEQQRIVEQIERALEKVDAYSESYNKLHELDKNFPDKLKKSILQYAMQGKLVPQDPDDEPVEVLLEKIKSEKQKLYEEGKLKKKDLAEIVVTEGDDSSPYQDVPYDLPESWEWVRLKTIYQVINGDRGKNYPSKDKLFENGEIPFINAGNIANEVISSQNLLYLSEEQYNKLGNGKLIKGDVIFCLRGSLGKFGIFNMEKGAIASSLVIIRPYYNNSKDIDIYFSKYLASPVLLSEIRKYNNGTAQPNLSAKALNNFFIPLPPLAEQKRIVSKISKIFSMIETLV